jgi:hypothetical protein
VLFERQHVTIESATKYFSADGARHIRLVVANASGGSAEFRKLAKIDDELFESLQPEVVNNLYVSLLNDDQSIISQPYEAKIDALTHGQPHSLDFKLLQDLDAVTVSLIYNNGVQRTMKIFLAKDSSQNQVAVQSEQFSQEVDLGSSAVYDLNLELFSANSNTFTLEALGLPEEISRTFKDPVSGARINQVRFAETARSKKVVLEVRLPERATEEIAIDEPIRFYAAVLPTDRAGAILAERGRQWSEHDFDTLGVGRVRLALIPRGRGLLQVRSNQMFEVIDADESAQFIVEVINEGTDVIHDISFGCDLPLSWRKYIEPSSITELRVEGDTAVTMAFTPPADATAGRYDIRVRTTAQSNGRLINGEDKTLTVEVRAASSVFGTLAIVFLIVGLVTGMVVFGVQLSRR